MKTNGKFKVIAVVLTAMMLLSAMSMSAFAASITYGDIAAVAVEDTDDYEVTVTYTAADCAEGDYVTVLVVVGNGGALNDDTNPTNVIYIDQQAVADGDGSFTFKVAKSTIDNQDVYVKLGATNQATAAAGSKTFTISTPSGDVTVTVDSSIADAFGIEGLKLIKVEGATGTQTLTVAGAEVVFVKNGDVPYYFVITTDTITASDLSFTETAPTESFIGDADGNATVNILDATAIINVLAGEATLDTNAAKFCADADNNGTINILDATGILNILAGETPPIFASSEE